MVNFDALFLISSYWIVQYCKMSLLFCLPPARAWQMKTIIEKNVWINWWNVSTQPLGGKSGPLSKACLSYSSFQHFMTTVCHIYLHRLTAVMFCNLSLTDKYKQTNVSPHLNILRCPFGSEVITQMLSTVFLIGMMWQWVDQGRAAVIELISLKEWICLLWVVANH